jgi:hypothetical protein
VRAPRCSSICSGTRWLLQNLRATLNGPADFAAAHRSFNDAFSNIQVELNELIAEDDKVAVRWTDTMTHTGDNLGFAATGRTVLMPGFRYFLRPLGTEMPSASLWMRGRKSFIFS